MSKQRHCQTYGFDIISAHALIAKAGQLLTFDEELSPCGGNTKLIACFTDVLCLIFKSHLVDVQSAETFVIGDLSVISVSELLPILIESELCQNILSLINAVTSHIQIYLSLSYYSI